MFITAFSSEIWENLPVKLHRAVVFSEERFLKTDFKSLDAYQMVPAF